MVKGFLKWGINHVFFCLFFFFLGFFFLLFLLVFFFLFLFFFFLFFFFFFCFLLLVLHVHVVLVYAVVMCTQTSTVYLRIYKLNELFVELYHIFSGGKSETGYEFVVGTDDVVVPAPAQSRDPPAATSRPTIPTVKAVSNEEARGALLDLVGQ